MVKTRRIEIAFYLAIFVVIFAVLCLAGLLGITSYVLLGFFAAVGLWGVLNFGRHILGELQQRHWAVLVYGPLVLLVIGGYSAMVIGFWLAFIG